MLRNRRLAIAAIVLASAFASASTASAGPILNWLGLGDDPKPSYTPLRYWAPTAARVGDVIHHKKLSVYPPDRHPEVPPTFTVIKYQSQIAAPGDTIIDPPTAPDASRAR